jgi:catechol 2,3-dioxygenase-like lactoylglutathione lyase family enzyme
MPGSELRWPNWVGIVVEDMQAQRAFYRDVLGFKELLVGDGWVQFDMGFPNVLELLERSAEPQYDRPRYQVGYAVEDIRSAREELVARGAHRSPRSRANRNRTDTGPPSATQRGTSSRSASASAASGSERGPLALTALRPRRGRVDLFQPFVPSVDWCPRRER